MDRRRVNNRDLSWPGQLILDGNAQRARFDGAQAILIRACTILRHPCDDDEAPGRLCRRKSLAALIGDDVVGLEARTVDVRHSRNMDQNGPKESPIGVRA